MANPTEFSLFNQFPAEIRRLIWRHALPGPRIHRISRHSAHGPSNSSCPPPDILFVCREAHDETLRVLKPLRLPSHPVACTFNTKRRTLCCLPVLINPQVDTVYLPGRAQFPLGYIAWFSRSDVDFSLVRSLAVDVRWSRPWLTGFDEKISVEEIVRRLGHVEGLHLVSEYSLFNPDIKYDYSAWGRIPEEGEPGWNWVQIVDTEVWEDVSHAKIWQENIARKLEAEKVRHEGEGDGKWLIPEVVLSFVKYERFPRKLEYRDEDEILGRLEPMKIEECRHRRFFWPDFGRLFTERLRIWVGFQPYEQTG